MAFIACHMYGMHYICVGRHGAWGCWRTQCAACALHTMHALGRWGDAAVTETERCLECLCTLRYGGRVSTPSSNPVTGIPRGGLDMRATNESAAGGRRVGQHEFAGDPPSGLLKLPQRARSTLQQWELMGHMCAGRLFRMLQFCHQVHYRGCSGDVSVRLRDSSQQRGGSNRAGVGAVQPFGRCVGKPPRYIMALRLFHSMVTLYHVSKGFTEVVFSWAVPVEQLRLGEPVQQQALHCGFDQSPSGRRMSCSPWHVDLCFDFPQEHYHMCCHLAPVERGHRRQLFHCA